MYVLLNFGEDPCGIKKCMPMCPIAHVPHHPCAPSPKMPHLYLQYEPRCPFIHVPNGHVSYCPYVKKMSSCQKDVKLSKTCQMSKSQTHGLWRRFIKRHIYITYDGDQNPQNVHRKCF